MIIFGITLHIHVSSLKLINYDEEHKFRVPIIINLGQQRHVGLGFLLKLELGTTLGLHVEWSLSFAHVFFLLFTQVVVKCQASSYERACTRIARWAPLGLCPHIENAQKGCAIIIITFDLHSIPLHSHKFLCMLIVTCQDSP